jgi:hypothetical protein
VKELKMFGEAGALETRLAPPMHWGLDNVFLGVIDDSMFNLLWKV